MYLSRLKVWNFRKFGEERNDPNAELSGRPGLDLQFNPHLNVLVGQNDSGKTSIIDAMKLVLLTQSREFIRIGREDFHKPVENDEDSRSNFFKIQCVFKGLSPEEASHFIEWIGVERSSGNKKALFLKVTLTAKRKGNSIYPEIKAGPDAEGNPFYGEARDYLRLTYLKPLRDAESELTPSRNSRLSQILDSHKSFREKETHPLIEIAKKANNELELFFEGKKPDKKPHDDLSGKELVEQINDYLTEFFGEIKNAGFDIAGVHLKGVLEKLSLTFAANKSGLGSHNLLFIAAELLLLEREDFSGLRLALIEEIEAHLHPQAQLRLIKYLQGLTADGLSSFQLILTSHSPNLASEVKLENLIVCHESKAFPMGPDFTMLNKGDYLFLERFLDVSKANLFFAKGLILVEGDAEALLIPTIAEVLDCSLVKNGVSVINVGSTAFLRYSRIFQRKNIKRGLLDVPVSIITDADVKPIEGKGQYKDKVIDGIGKNLAIERAKIEKRYNGQSVKTYVSKFWTLEYDLACSQLRKDFYLALLYAEYIKNSDKYGLTDKKRQKALKRVKDDFLRWETNWKDDDRKDRKIAYKIYNDYMLKKGQLKSITAQCFAQLLKEKAEKSDAEKIKLKTIFETDEYLAYLTNAIRNSVS